MEHLGLIIADLLPGAVDLPTLSHALICYPRVHNQKDQVPSNYSNKNLSFFFVLGDLW